MNDESNIINADEDVMLPEGWDGKSDIFASPETAPEAAPEAAPEVPTTDTAAGEAPTTEPPEAEKGAEAQAPTTAPEQAAPDAAPEAGKPDAGKIKFQARLDHGEREVELDPTELPGVWQRSQVTERVQQRMAQMQPRLDRAERLARELGYQSLDEMVDKAGARYRESQVEQMVKDGTPKAMAEFIVSQKARENAAPTTPSAAGTAQAGTRDFFREVAELRDTFPDAVGKDGRLPDEVMKAATREGKSLVAAYAKWSAKQQAAQAQQLQRQNQVLKQNQENKQKAPVTGATGGGATNQKAVDPFLAGFEDDNY